MIDFNPQLVKSQLKALNKTQEELAIAVGVNVSTLNRWIKGHHRPLKIYRIKILEIIEGWENERQANTVITSRGTAA